MDRTDQGKQMPNSCGTMSTFPKAAYFEFNEPFHRLVMVRDKKRKSKRLLACLEDNWTLTVTMAPTGLAILDHSIYSTLNMSYFMQCTNATLSSVGFVCIGRLNKDPVSMRRIAKLRNVPAAGSLPNCFLAIPQGLYFLDGQLMVVFHKLDLSKIGNIGVTETMKNYNDVDSFVRNIFTQKSLVMLENDVEFCPMNAIAGPIANFFKVRKSTYLTVAGVRFIEMRNNPDTWTNTFLDRTTRDLKLIHIKDSAWRSGQGIKPKKNKRQRRNNTKAYNLLKLQKLQQQCSKEAYVHMCRRKPLLVGKKYSSGIVIEYLTSNASPVTLIVELTVPQKLYVDCVFADYVHLHPIKQYNRMLDYLLLESGRKKMEMIRITVNEHSTNSVMISLLSDDNIPCRTNTTQLSRNVWRSTLSNTKNDVLDA